ncbi:MAG: hypothetical protein ABJC89_21045 [Acidobacteriota bacterium]
MPEERAADPTRVRREHWIAAAALTAIVLFRSAAFLVWPQIQFDSDQAITGLMAKHLSELRAFPVFYYGQNYMLAVEAWLAAPVFAIAGVSVTTLRLPLLAINLGVALGLLRVFEREVGLRPMLALVAALFFALPPPGTTAHLLEANGGNVEPFAYVLLLWMTRRRPAIGGIIFAIGFLQREFTVYGFLALLALEAFQRTLFTREGALRRLRMLRTAAEVWLFVQWIKYYSSAAGPGSSMGDVYQPHDNLVELAHRICLDLGTLPRGLWRLLTIHWPILFGVTRQPVLDFGVDATASQGAAWGWVLLAAAALIAAAGVAGRLLTERRWRPEYDFCAYLMAAAAWSNLGYVIARCGEVGFVLMRYELLSLLGAAGLSAWFLKVTKPGWLQRAWIALVCACIAISALSHTRILTQYAKHQPPHGKLILAKQLEARGIHYAKSSYWIAYAVTFLMQERTIIASEDFVRIREYQRIVDEHKAESIRIARDPCPGGRPVMDGVWFCPE